MSEGKVQRVVIKGNGPQAPQNEVPPDYRPLTEAESAEIQATGFELQMITNEANRWAAEQDAALARAELFGMKKDKALAKMLGPAQKLDAMNKRLGVTVEGDLKKIDGRLYVRVKPEPPKEPEQLKIENA